MPGDGVDQRQVPLELLPQPRRPPQRARALRAQVHGAKYLAEGSGYGARIFDMHAGPYGTVGVVQHFGRIGSQNKAAKGPVPVSWHGDQADRFLAGELSGRGPFAALFWDPIRPKVPYP